MRGQLALVQRDLTGGLNLRDSPWDIADSESPLVADFQPYGLGGAIVRRYGDSLGTSWVGNGNGAGRIFTSRSLNRFYIPTTLSALIEIPVGGGSSAAVEPSGSAPDARYSIIEAPATGGQGPIYYVTPATPPVPKYWTGSAGGNWTATTGTVPAARYLLYHGNRVWAARPETDKDAVFWSELGDPRNWPVANVTRFGVGDGEAITAIGTVGPYIVVFKETRCWLIYDLDTSANRPIGKNGHVLPTCAPLDTPYGLVFSDARRGLCITNGDRIDSIGDYLPGQLPIDFAYFDDSLFVAGAVVGLVQQLFEYRFKSKTWWAHTVAGLNGLGVFLNQLWGVRATNTALYRLFDSTSTANVDGVTLTPRWRSRFSTLGDAQIAKRLRSVEFAGEGTFTVIGRKNHETADVFTEGPFTLPTVNESNRQQIPSLGVANALQLEFQGSGTDRQRLDEISVRITTRKD